MKKAGNDMTIWQYKKSLNYKSNMAIYNITEKNINMLLYIIIIIQTYIIDFARGFFDVKLTKGSFWGLTFSVDMIYLY